MKIDFTTSFPIYLQIQKAFQQQSAGGVLKPGDKIPSQRDLAVQLKVNVNTVQRAYREMEALGLVETLRGQGTFVAQNEAVVAKMRREMLRGRVADFIRDMQALGCGPKEISALMESHWPGFQDQGEEVRK